LHRLVLTFDDGPVTEHTPRILDALAKYNATATFFVVGQQLTIPGAMEIVRRAAREGHFIGNHSFDHPDLTKLPPEKIRSQILRTHDLIGEFEPQRRLFRPPYGLCNPAVKKIAKSLGYELVFWNSSSEDWRPENASSAWVNTAIEQVSPQHAAMCLFHDQRHTAEHLPDFLERLRSLGTHEIVDYYHRRDFRAYAYGAGRRLRRLVNSGFRSMTVNPSN
jgi:peptidoglycan/xylan/chitin deacetylase (PgdA/CDA1 family)